MNFVNVVGLNCIKCSSNSYNSTCYKEPAAFESVQCPTDFAKCQVWKLYSEINDEIYMFERGCSWTCTRGCITLSDMENRFVSCASCCDLDNCNTDNPSSKPNHSFLTIIPSLLLVDGKYFMK